MTNKDHGVIIDRKTGEILDDPMDGTVVAEVLPAVRSTRADLDSLPASLDELIASYIEPEPDPRQVFLWINEMADMEVEDDEDPSLSIAIRIMQGSTAEEILGAQEVIPADELLGEQLTIKDIKFRKSTFADGARCYVLITAHRHTTDSEALISCGAKNVQLQCLRMRHAGLMPFDAAIMKARKATAKGFYPLFLDPR